jgi:hypothetical protein
MLVLVLVTLVVVVRAKSLKFVSIRVLKIREVLGWECNFFSCLGSGKSKAAQNCFDKSIKNKRGFGMRVQLFFTFR